MDLNTILELSWVPIIVFGIALGYGVILLSTKDPKILISKTNPKAVRDRKKYAVEAGKLLIFLAIGSLIMSVLLFVNLTAAFAEIIIWFTLFAIQWKKVSDLYGPIN